MSDGTASLTDTFTYDAYSGLYPRFRRVIRTGGLLVVIGHVQREGTVTNLRAGRVMRGARQVL